MCNYLNKTDLFSSRTNLGAACRFAQSDAISPHQNQKVLLLDNTLRVTLAVSQMSIKNKHWILGNARGRFPLRRGSDVTTQAELPVCQTLPLTYYRALSHHWSEDGQLSVDKKACVSLRTDACQSNCQAWTTAWFSPALWSRSACPPVASSVLLRRASATRLTCLPVPFDLNAAVPLPASRTGLTECLKWRAYQREHIQVRGAAGGMETVHLLGSATAT